VALVNSATDALEKPKVKREDRQPGLVALYDIRPGNGAGLYSFNPEPARGENLVNYLPEYRHADEPV